MTPDTTTTLSEYLPILIPLAIIQLGLMLWALIHVLTHKHYRIGSRALWIVVVIVFSLLGPICYFVFGRGDNEAD